MKTQERRMKHCISATLSLLMLLFWPKDAALAYSSLTPWQDEAGPRDGLIFEPRFGYQATDQNTLELNLNLNAALTSNLSAFGRYSVQTDQLAGLAYGVFQNEKMSLSLQGEITDSQDSNLGFTLGAFAKIPMSFLAMPSLTAEVGIGFRNLPALGSTTLPLSLLVTHDPNSSGWYYGAGFVGESAVSTADTWIAFQAKAGFQYSSGIRYGAQAALPATGVNSENNAAISFSLSVPFGKSKSETENLARPTAEISNDLNPNYNLDAKVISMNEALYLIKIDRGSNDSVSKGQTFDIYSGETRMARAQVIAVKKDEAALSVIEYTQEYWIELGFSARRLF